MGLTIRTARIADRARILAISAQIWEGEDFVPQVIDEWLHMRNSEVAVAELGGVVIAFARTVDLAPGYVWLEGIRTDTAQQGHGAGKALTEYFIEKASRQGAQRIGLSTYIDNLASIHVVELFGFRREATFILAEAMLESPARCYAVLSPSVVTIPFDEACAWIRASSVLAMGNGFLPQGWKFWPVTRTGVSAWPPFKAAFGLRDRKGALRSLLIACQPDHGADTATIDFADGSPEDLGVLVRHALAVYPGAKCVEVMVPAREKERTPLLDAVTALEFDIWRHGEPDVLVFERPVSPL